MNRVLIIGAGGVGSVVTQKCARLPEVFGKITLASRTIEKCENIARLTDNPIEIRQIDADDTSKLIKLMEEVKPNLVINVALPYQDLSIMDACLAVGSNYLDTANYEPRDEAKFCYKWQWDYQEKFKENKLMALLGCGFDPGVTNIFCAYAAWHKFDEIHHIDIMDCNGGSHGKAFATNFNPEINIREVTAPGRYYENGEWIETEPLSIHRAFDFDEIGTREMYLMYHEELESLVKNIPTLKSIRFWMTFGQEYLTHLRVLQNVGMTRIDPVNYNGHDIIPLQFLKALLPEPSSLGENYEGKTNIGCSIFGLRNNQMWSYYIYNVCNHQDAYKDVKAQAIAYTTGVPAMIGAKMMLTGKWTGHGVFNVEEFDPDPFMRDLRTYGLPFKEKLIRV